MATIGPRRLDAKARLRALTSDITALILNRDLLAGDPLPTEQELMAELGVGRNSLREAVKVLQALGIIDTRHGFGMFVAENNLSALHDSLAFRGQMSLRHRGHEAGELVEVRQALETGLIGQAIRVVSEEHLLALEATVIRMEQSAQEGDMFADADRDFHRILFEPLNNTLLSNLLGVFWEVYHSIHDVIGEEQPDNPTLVETAAAHRAIFDAVRAKDIDAARLLLADHFQGIRQLLAVMRGRAK
ncbi:FadR/GntR family transcriptional regulator [Glutamicibacter sp.]|jgi:Transcriptional regulators|uniref:FadR/GntR family transcriptional regulator n=1 Tax=Glutamicibacter sp. TaxID=1931995 RepID=UPI002B48D68E|nr:FCD domain-containing protein [Glutamicibacter sp.]HJX77197.1 FCD domain-containing protein [Glutamicibacter sp.]